MITALPPPCLPPASITPRRPGPMTAALAALGIAALGLVAGCSTPHAEPAAVRFDGSHYAAYFDAAREALLEQRFELDRVDARGGVITSAPKVTAGLATPWDTEQSSLMAELEDFANPQLRTIRIVFSADPPAPEPAVAPQSAGADPPPDLRPGSGPMLAQVVVVIDRQRRPGRRLEAEAVQTSSYSTDPALVSRGLQPAYSTPVSRDPGLERRLARRLRELAERP